ncbi:hypothetical protein BMW24_003445 [Mycobacterium heckeshornense]|uniref:hypothetical protein n=1 Tax=Mycobacterium heckeshornense TaxID=110505 RepID=UPI0008FD5A2F|nr:hypothetical protein [Mycobacterium heckeshornense]PIJ36732.1 hypothetical protein BMW24_003160 [Mycobacterium heckeshornense]PIJ36783.1 hypothetical protein BMW24_003445 [Mycobacterium heckeshornense]
MTTYPLIYATNDATILPQGAADLLDGTIPTIKFTSPDGNSKFTLCGPEAPWPGIQDGILLAGGLAGLTPGFKHIDLKGARQPGVTWTYTMYDTCNLTMHLQAHATTPQGMSRLVSEWIGAWNPNLQGSLEYWTVDRGYWWFPARWNAAYTDLLKQLPRTVLYQELTHQVRNDLAFWLGVPWTDTFPRDTSGWAGSGSGWLQLGNIGDQDGWPAILCYAGTEDGATFSFANGPGSTTMITFGPLNAGDIVLINTLSRLPRVVDLTPPKSQAPQSGSPSLLATLINFVSNNNVPPLLQQFESKFGVLPQTSPLASLITGNYTNPIPGVAQPQYAQPAAIACSITGGNPASKMVASITPMRVWPE